MKNQESIKFITSTPMKHGDYTELNQQIANLKNEIKILVAENKSNL